MRDVVLLWSKCCHACLPLMCLSIIRTRPLSPNTSYIFACVPPFTLIFSILMKTQSLPLLPCLDCLPSPLLRAQWIYLSDTCFNLFLLLAPSLFFSASLLSPHGRVSYNFYSLVPPAWLLSPPSAHLPHLHFLSTHFLDSPSSMCSLLLCIFFLSMLHLVECLSCSFSSSSHCPMYLSWGGVC